MFAQISTAKNHYPHLFNFENYPKYSTGYTGIINKIHVSPKRSCKVGYTGWAKKLDCFSDLITL